MIAAILEGIGTFFAILRGLALIQSALAGIIKLLELLRIKKPNA